MCVLDGRGKNRFLTLISSRCATRLVDVARRYGEPASTSSISGLREHKAEAERERENERARGGEERQKNKKRSQPRKNLEACNYCLFTALRNATTNFKP